MRYLDNLDYEKLQQVEEKGQYLKAIQMLIEDVKYNYDRVPKDNNLINIYTSIAYLGKENGLMPKTEEKILAVVKKQRESFIKVFEEI